MQDTKKSPKIRHLRTIAQLYRAVCIFATKACIDNRKNLLISNISSTCSYTMVNFGPLAAEIDPANFNGIRVLAALLRGI